MRRDHILSVLRDHRDELNRKGVTHAALFGSVARGDSLPQSDIDVMIEFDAKARITIWDYAGVVEFVKSLFDGPVDVVARESLNRHIRPSAEKDAIYAF